MFHRVLIFIRRRVKLDRHGNSSRKDDRPHRQTGQLGVSFRADGLRTKRIHDGQEAIDADAGEEEDAPVHVCVKQGHGYLAEDLAEYPFPFHEVDDSEGKAENKK